MKKAASREVKAEIARVIIKYKEKNRKKTIQRWWSEGSLEGNQINGLHQPPYKWDHLLGWMEWRIVTCQVILVLFFLSFWKVFFFLLQTFSNLRDCRVCQGNILAPQECVTALIKKTNFNTAAGPHAGHRETLFQPAQQGFKPNVFGVFFSEFLLTTANFSQSEKHLMSNIIFSIPNSKNVKKPNGFMALSLTSHWWNTLSGKLDPLQFAYHAGKCMESSSFSTELVNTGRILLRNAIM